MLVFLVAGTRRHADLFGGVGGNFIRGRRRGVGDFGRAWGCPGFGLGFGFGGGWRGGFVGADFAEVKILDGVLVMDGGCCDGAEEERWTTQGAHAGGLERGLELALCTDRVWRGQLRGEEGLL